MPGFVSGRKTVRRKVATRGRDRSGGVRGAGGRTTARDPHPFGVACGMRRVGRRGRQPRALDRPVGGPFAPPPAFDGAARDRRPGLSTRRRLGPRPRRGPLRNDARSRTAPPRAGRGSGGASPSPVTMSPPAPSSCVEPGDPCLQKRPHPTGAPIVSGPRATRGGDGREPAIQPRPGAPARGHGAGDRRDGARMLGDRRPGHPRRRPHDRLGERRRRRVGRRDPKGPRPRRHLFRHRQRLRPRPQRDPRRPDAPRPRRGPRRHEVRIHGGRRGRRDGQAPRPARRDPAACEASLRRLGRDHIDLYQLHVGSLPDAEADAAAGTLEELQSQGLIRHFGWSSDVAPRPPAGRRGARARPSRSPATSWRTSPSSSSSARRPR